MDKRRWGQWILLAVVCLSFSIGESYAQKNDFANLRRYSKENAALPQATKKDKRVIFMGNSITEGWVRTHPNQMVTLAVESVGRLPINSCYGSGKM